MTDLSQDARTTPILFLDIDGVLNSEAWYRARPEGTWSEDREFDPEAMFLLRAIVKMTKCNIVVSSSWRIGRKLHELKALLRGMPVIGTTPIMTTGYTRGAEVRAFLEDWPLARYAILDDSSDFYDDQPLVRTEWKTGLRPRDCERVIAYLGEAA